MKLTWKKKMDWALKEIASLGLKILLWVWIDVRSAFTCFQSIMFSSRFNGLISAIELLGIVVVSVGDTTRRYQDVGWEHAKIDKNKGRRILSWPQPTITPTTPSGGRLRWSFATSFANLAHEATEVAKDQGSLGNLTFKFGETLWETK